MKFNLTSIDGNHDIQCRARTAKETVNEYAQLMSEGVQFPPIEVFGDQDHAWVGDGWHRVEAALQIGCIDIEVHLNPGGRIEALKFALTANAGHGLRRTNEDKKKAVSVALREFPKFSARRIAETCAVSHELVNRQRRELATDASSFVGLDGKERRPRKPSEEWPESEIADADFVEHKNEPAKSTPILGPPREGLRFARSAIMDLEQIRTDDTERAEAFTTVRGWIDEHE